jgi:hypothetical protein
MLRTGLMAVCAFALIGCAPTLSGANERGGIVENLRPRNVADAFNVADTHCKQHGRVARISQQTEDTLTFDCVAP